jgi:signal recognition particle receptor subunit beta
MFVNRRKGELNLKIVYYGPALSGKTTNLEFVHAKTDPKARGDLVSLKTREDRTVFFDYLLLEVGKIANLRPRFNLYTVPGQVYYTSSRKLVLQGADGIVFVADSQIHRQKANRQALHDMVKYMRALGLNPRKVPIVMQFNKRDLKNITPVDEMRDYLGITKTNLPCFEASALYGDGVFTTLKTTINLVIKQIQQEIKSREAQRAAVR